MAELFNIITQHLVQHIPVPDPVAGDRHPLDDGQLGLDDLLQRPGELGVAAEAQFIGEPDDGRFADADGGAHLGRRHKSGFIGVAGDEIGNPLLAFGKGRAGLCNLIQNIH